MSLWSKSWLFNLKGLLLCTSLINQIQRFLTAETPQYPKEPGVALRLVPWENPHVTFLLFLCVSVLCSREPSRCPGCGASSPAALPGTVTRTLWKGRLRGHSSESEQKWNLRRFWARSAATHAPLGGVFMAPNTEQWKFDKPQVSAWLILRLTPFSTNSCFPTSTDFLCFVYFNQGLHNRQITQKYNYS